MDVLIISLLLTTIVVIMAIYIFYVIYMFPYLICPSKNKLRLCLNLFLNFTVICWLINLFDSILACCNENDSKNDSKVIGLKDFKNTNNTVTTKFEDYHTNTSQVEENNEEFDIEDIKQRLIDRKRRCL